MRAHLFLVATLVLIILLIGCTDRCEGRRGGFRGVRRSSYRSTRRTSSTRRTRISKTPTTYRSTAYRSQVTTPKPFSNRFLAGAVITYALLKAPIYSGGYRPYYHSQYIIPQDKALRVKEERYSILKKSGEDCGNPTDSRTLQEKLKNNDAINTTNTVDYSQGNADTQTNTSTGSTDIILRDVSDTYIIDMKTRSEYNQTLLTDPDCTVFVHETKAYMVDLDSAAVRKISNIVSILSAIFVCIKFA